MGTLLLLFNNTQREGDGHVFNVLIKSLLTIVLVKKALNAQSNACFLPTNANTMLILALKPRWLTLPQP